MIYFSGDSNIVIAFQISNHTRLMAVFIFLRFIKDAFGNCGVSYSVYIIIYIYIYTLYLHNRFSIGQFYFNWSMNINNCTVVLCSYANIINMLPFCFKANFPEEKSLALSANPPTLSSLFYFVKAINIVFCRIEVLKQ